MVGNCGLFRKKVLYVLKVGLCFRMSSLFLGDGFILVVVLYSV